MKFDKLVKIATIDVDSGMVWIGDPCYLSGPKSRIKNWDKFCDQLTSGPAYIFGHDNKKPANSGEEGEGICVNTLHGDGLYSVYAKYKGCQITQVIIDFEQLDDVE